MSETRSFPSRPILLAAVWGSPWPSRRRSRCRLVPAVLSVEQGEGETAVRYIEDGVEVLAAVVTAGRDMLDIRGTVAGLPYAWSSTWRRTTPCTCRPRWG